MPRMIQTLESLSWNIFLTVLLHSVESEKNALYEAGDHTNLQVFAKASTQEVMNTMILQLCTGFFIQDKHPCNPNCKFGESLLEFLDLHSEHVPWPGTVHTGNTETMLTSEHSARQT